MAAPAAIATAPRTAYNQPMPYEQRLSEAEFHAFIDETRAEVARRLAEIESADSDAMPAAMRAELERARQELLELQAQLTEEAVQAELEATELLGRELAQAEAKGLVTKQ